MKNDVLIWGAGGHAKVVADIIRLSGQSIIGFIDDLNPHRKGEHFLGSQILGGIEELDLTRRQDVEQLIVCIGDCQTRARLSNLALQKEYKLAKAVHPSAIIAADTEIGCGTVITAGGIVNSGTKIGQSVIINTGAIIDHDCIIEDSSHICPGATLGGGVIVKRESWIGLGAKIKDHVIVGERTLIGVGAVVISDIPDRVMAFGVPAKVIRENV